MIRVLRGGHGCLDAYRHEPQESPARATVYPTPDQLSSTRMTCVPEILPTYLFGSLPAANLIYFRLI
eukprot:950462-Pleurochrysis_carterae.AAC.1